MMQLKGRQRTATNVLLMLLIVGKPGYFVIRVLIETQP